MSSFSQTNASSPGLPHVSCSTSSGQSWILHTWDDCAVHGQLSSSAIRETQGCESTHSPPLLQVEVGFKAHPLETSTSVRFVSTAASFATSDSPVPRGNSNVKIHCVCLSRVIILTTCSVRSSQLSTAHQSQFDPETQNHRVSSLQQQQGSAPQRKKVDHRA